MPASSWISLPRSRRSQVWWRRWIRTCRIFLRRNNWNNEQGTRNFEYRGRSKKLEVILHSDFSLDIRNSLFLVRYSNYLLAHFFQHYSSNLTSQISTMPNRLIKETSPYLLQHAHNPVDWYPWGEEALNKAKSEDKPMLVSIGYAACHWCHVMEKESFEDDETA